MSTLYIMATPLGNLKDFSFRALELLKSVDIIAAEDTRHSQKLLQSYGIARKIVSYHKDNELKSAKHLINLLKSGKSVALISDAGTPLISDPGYSLVALAHENHLVVSPVPGPCAAIAALSVSGLACDKFVFEGFLPSAKNARKTRLKELKTESRTILFYEAPHRIVETLQDCCDILGPSRKTAFARELTKTFETVRASMLGELLEFVEQNSVQQQGEIVFLVEGALEDSSEEQLKETKAQHLLKALLEELPVKKSVKIASEMLGISKNKLYALALKMKEN